MGQPSPPIQASFSEGTVTWSESGGSFKPEGSAGETQNSSRIIHGTVEEFRQDELMRAHANITVPIPARAALLRWETDLETLSGSVLATQGARTPSATIAWRDQLCSHSRFLLHGRRLASAASSLWALLFPFRKGA